MAIYKSLMPALTSALLLAACASAPQPSLQTSAQASFQTSQPASPKKADQALIKASRKGDAVLVASLINAGADMNAVDEEGWTPYLAASVEGNWQVMKLLQTRGAKTDPGF